MPLHSAEDHFGLLCEELATTLEKERLPKIDKDYARLVLLHLDLAETSAPEVPWGASLRGRLHLAHAVVAFHRCGLSGELPSAWSAEDEADLRRELAAVESLLRRASRCASDPVAALALAARLDLLLAHDDVHAREEAAGLARRALDLLERLRPEGWDFGLDNTSGVRLAHQWTWAQFFLLRPESSEQSARFDFVVDHHTSD